MTARSLQTIYFRCRFFDSKGSGGTNICTLFFLVTMSPAAPAAPSSTVAETSDNLPFLANVLNHLLTPGSSLTSSVWTAFNVIMAWLFACWLLFLFSFPTNIHVWAFGILGLGLLLSTNWFMNEIFKAGLDYESTQKKEQQGKKKLLHDNTAKTRAMSGAEKQQQQQQKQQQQQQPAGKKESNTGGKQKKHK